MDWKASVIDQTGLYRRARRTILRTVHPIRRDFGWQAGQTIHRYYTEERFLPQFANDIRGHVLEIGDRRYTRRFGGTKVMRSDVLHAKPGNEQATIVADLTCTEHISSDTFDCVVLTFTLQCVYDVRAAMKTLNRILKPRGVLLMTVPGISQIARYDDDNWGDYWRFTSRCLRRLLEETLAGARQSHSFSRGEGTAGGVRPLSWCSRPARAHAVLHSAR